MWPAALLLLAGLLCPPPALSALGPPRAGAFAPPAPAAAQKRAQEPEEIPEVDPYTEGDRERMEALGYRRFAPFVVFDDADTGEVRQVLGDVPILWVETTHFRIGCSLEPYTVAQDRTERAKIRTELSRLSKRLPGVKKNARELDRWLLLHLWAQRLEDLYADFGQAVGVTDADFPLAGAARGMGRTGSGPYLGQPSPFTVLLLAKQSSLGRLTSHYLQREAKHSQRWYFHRSGTMFFGISYEAMIGTYENDTALHCAVAHGVTQNFFDGLRAYTFRTPAWLGQGLGHWFSRRVDERFNVYGGGLGTPGMDEDGWKWAPRVKARVKHEYYPTWETLFGWRDESEMKPADHMMCWSRVDFLLQEPTAMREFLLELKAPVPSGGDSHDQIVERQRKLLPRAFGASLEELEAQWARWVSRTYPSR